MLEELSYLESLKGLGSKLGLEVPQQVVEALDHPERRFKVLHIAGTNGKGSTAAFLASILQEAGYRVGLYTSPHLVKFNERIQINGEEITDAELRALVEQLKSTFEKNNVQPTFFEFTTGLAFQYFADKQVDFGVIEVGLGGRLDATNVVQPQLGVITNIGLEHTKVLGDTIYQIAQEKAGIIKKGMDIVVGERDPFLLDYFKSVCDERGARFHGAAEQVKIVSSVPSDIGQDFTVSGTVRGTFGLSMLGRHQIENACTALLATHVLGSQGVNIGFDVIRRGLLNCRWPGRLEIVSRKPFILVDGAHNSDGMRVLSEFAKTLDRRRVLVIGISEGKDIQKMLELIVPLFDEVIVTQGTFKPTEASVLVEDVKKFADKVHVKEHVADAVALAKEFAAEDDVVLIAGSLYMIGDALKVLR